MIGLFVGPIVLSIGWQLLVAWTRDEPSEPEEASWVRIKGGKQ
jgi:hypothetical protein